MLRGIVCAASDGMKSRRVELVDNFVFITTVGIRETLMGSNENQERPATGTCNSCIEISSDEGSNIMCLLPLMSREELGPCGH